MVYPRKALSRPAKSGTLIKISAIPALALLAPLASGRVPGYFHLPLAGLIEKISVFMRRDTQKVNKEHKKLNKHSNTDGS